MIDKAERTRQLLTLLTAAVPFEVDLTSELLTMLRQKHCSGALERRQTVSQVFYLGDDGGIMCHIQPPDEANPIVTSITHIRVPAYLPFAPSAGLPKASGQETAQAAFHEIM